MLKITHNFIDVTRTERWRVKIQEVGVRRKRRLCPNLSLEKAVETYLGRFISWNRGTREIDGEIYLYHLEVVFLQSKLPPSRGLSYYIVVRVYTRASFSAPALIISTLFKFIFVYIPVEILGFSRRNVRNEIPCGSVQTPCKSDQYRRNKQLENRFFLNFC